MGRLQSILDFETASVYKIACFFLGNWSFTFLYQKFPVPANLENWSLRNLSAGSWKFLAAILPTKIVEIRNMNLHIFCLVCFDYPLSSVMSICLNASFRPIFNLQNFHYKSPHFWKFKAKISLNRTLSQNMLRRFFLLWTIYVRVPLYLSSQSNFIAKLVTREVSPCLHFMP